MRGIVLQTLFYLSYMINMMCVVGVCSIQVLVRFSHTSAYRAHGKCFRSKVGKVSVVR